MKPLTYIRMVLWSFFGIRRSTSAESEITQAHPLLLIATAVALAAAFVLVLITVARLASS
ncbi:MAG: DUF2970 domain-containing protein [Burkholderiales bacterium]|jgi:hypothetical protein|nr:MAG: DUF2970 domain-containing protein [Burkholderiales bacterium]